MKTKMKSKKMKTKKLSAAAARAKVRKITKPKDAKEEKEMIKKVQRGVNISLYAGNKTPSKSVKGTGFGNAARARETLAIVARDCRDLVHQKQVVLTMFNRAKHHPHRTPGMLDAMRVFAPWLARHGVKAPM